VSLKTLLLIVALILFILGALLIPMRGFSLLSLGEPAVKARVSDIARRLDPSRGRALEEPAARATRLAPAAATETRRTATGTATEALRLLLVTLRPAIHDYFVGLDQHTGGGLSICQIPISMDALDQRHADLDAAALAVVDVTLDPAASLELCRELRRQRPAMPISGLLCCPHAVTPWLLRELHDAGIGSLFDLGMTSEQAMRALRGIARGEVILHLQLRPEREASIGHLTGTAGRDTESSPPLRIEADVRLLRLLAAGLSDLELGKRLHLSPHTIKHHIERLRRFAGA
jgi:DNA-binding NarL/FixJ family response regulator